MKRELKNSGSQNPNNLIEVQTSFEQAPLTEPGASNGNSFGLRKYIVSLALLIITPLLVSAWGDSTKVPFIGYVASAFQDKIGGEAAIQERKNVALATNGGTATASSANQERWPPASVINGDRKGIGWGAGGGWADDTPNVFPDWIQVEFSESMIIDEIDVFTLQDAWWNPVEPTQTMTFGNNGITRFDVQYWNGSAWVTVPGGGVTSNSNVWRQFTFSQIVTQKIRVLVHAARTANSTVVEVEAYGVPQASPAPTPSPSPTPTPVTVADLAALDIFFDAEKNIGIGTQFPIFNDDHVTGAFVGKWFAIDGKFPGASAYLGVGGSVTTPHHRVGALNFYNRAMGGVDNRTAAILSFNGNTLGTGTLDFYTSPNIIGPMRRMQIAPTGEVGINHAAGAGTMLSVMGRTTDATTNALGVLDGNDGALMIVRSDGQVTISKAGQGIVLKSPNGLVCKKLTIDNAGNLVVGAMGTCP